jgi:TRAP-type C4-dicarboxylate transport system substrate-binding protein
MAQPAAPRTGFIPVEEALTMKRLTLLSICLIGLLAVPLHATEKADPLEAWKPKFNPAGAQYTYLLSNVDTPMIEGIGVGFKIRDKVWERSNGRLYVDFRPLAQLGGEKDVISKLKLGAVQGMLCSSVAAVNVADRLGLVNLPFVVESFDKLERFRADQELFREYGATALEQGVMVADFTGYGGYGWATKTPVRTLDDARKVNFRVAQAPLNTDLYKAWGLKFTVMPWPDVPQALQTGVIDGLDHTIMVCSITRKFDFAPNFTRLDYAQGLYIHLINKRWLEQLPADLQKILLDTIAEESAAARQAGQRQLEAEIAAAQAKGVQFHALSAADRKTLMEMSAPVYGKWEERIGKDFVDRVRKTLGE